MKAQIWYFRIYTTHDYYTRSTSIVQGREFSISPSIAATVSMGDVPEDILDAHGRSSSVLRYFIDRSCEIERKDPPVDWVSKETAYICLGVKFSVDLPVRDGAEGEAYAWYEYLEAEKVIEGATSKARDLLDEMSLIVLVKFGREIVARQIFDSRAYIIADGKPSQPVPIFRAGRAVAIRINSPETLPFGELEKLTVDDFRYNPAAVSIGRWMSLGLAESDPFKKFMWGFIGIEVLVKKVVSKNPDIIANKLRFSVDEGEDVAGIAVRELIWPAPSTAAGLRDLGW
ncbi:hypothetical protein LWC34_54770 [Kibdelosporangium philippinense]|uniref:Type I-A CRISPR-associated protein Cas5 n=1 Tax=Kibdelosporangium philippinense TaxID=211113 RepID=A0ABS8ZVR3_9PSEU|nr:hypothetical protein [Kibdelosporangium philippinense]MCE7011824.1 hypothetical protein [Kibdelosporangium philippinense]